MCREQSTAVSPDAHAPFRPWRSRLARRALPRLLETSRLARTSPHSRLARPRPAPLPRAASFPARLRQSCVPPASRTGSRRPSFRPRSGRSGRTPARPAPIVRLPRERQAPIVPSSRASARASCIHGARPRAGPLPPEALLSAVRLPPRGFRTPRRSPHARGAACSAERLAPSRLRPPLRPRAPFPPPPSPSCVHPSTTRRSGLPSRGGGW
jgi:hypothetical protein